MWKLTPVYSVCVRWLNQLLLSTWLEAVQNDKQTQIHATQQTNHSARSRFTWHVKPQFTISRNNIGQANVWG